MTHGAEDPHGIWVNVYADGRKLFCVGKNVADREANTYGHHNPRVRCYQEPDKTASLVMKQEIKHGGPAYPVPHANGGASFKGFTKRERFAADALVGMLSHPTRYKPRPGAHENWHRAIADEAVELADALIEALEARS